MEKIESLGLEAGYVNTEIRIHNCHWSFSLASNWPILSTVANRFVWEHLNGMSRISGDVRSGWIGEWKVNGYHLWTSGFYIPFSLFIHSLTVLSRLLQRSNIRTGNHNLIYCNIAGISFNISAKRKTLAETCFKNSHLPIILNFTSPEASQRRLPRTSSELEKAEPPVSRWRTASR